jgi:heme d1 biosynthesis radical SAM protein NirJ
MLRITQYMKLLRAPATSPPTHTPCGPVVIWNLVRRCNLTCQHCYSISCDRDFPNELDTAEVFRVMEDLKTYRVPVLILSGGEPLLRPDIFALAQRAKALGFYVGLSTNGTLIDQAMAARIAAVGFDYVGVSLDGLEQTHDRFRRKAGAHRAALNGIRRCREAGVKVGVRFTLTEANAAELPAMLELLDLEAIDKFYLSHLNYAGRGYTNRRKDAVLHTTRAAMDRIFDACWRDLERGVEREYVTGNNDADGVYLLQWAQRRLPLRAGVLRQRLAQWGGNASGVSVANIDNVGNVHPDTYWWHYSLGNVRERPFSRIWSDTSDPVMAGLKSRPRPVKGRCGACAYLDVCGGNTRVRALQTTGDLWAEDPACYLDDAEIGLQAERLLTADDATENQRASTGAMAA